MNISQLDLLRQFRHISLAITMLFTPLVIGLTVFSLRSGFPQVLFLVLLAFGIISAHWIGGRQARLRGDIRWAIWFTTISVLLAMNLPAFLLPNFWRVGLVLAMIPILEAALVGQPRMMPGIIALMLVGAATMLSIDVWYAPPRVTVFSGNLGWFLTGFSAILLGSTLVGGIAWRQRLWKVSITLNTQFSVLFAIISTLSILTAVGFSVIQLRSSEVQQIGQSFEKLAEFNAERVGNSLEQQVNLLRLFWHDQTLLYGIRTANSAYGATLPVQAAQELRQKEMDWQAAAPDSPLVQDYATTNLQSQALQRFATSNPHLSNLVATDMMGGLVASTVRKPEHFYFGDQAWWQVAWQGGKGGLYFGDLEFDSNTGAASVLIALAIRDPQTVGSGGDIENAQPVGVIAARYELSTLQAYFYEERTPTGGTVNLIAQDGTLIAGGTGTVGGSAWPELMQTDLLQRPETGWAFGLTDRHKAGILGYGALRTTSQSILEPLQQLGWRVIILDSEADALASVTRSMKNVGIASALIVALIMLVASRVARLFAQPLEILTQTAIAVTEGDLSKRAALPGTRSLEVLTLTHSLNDLTDRLQQTLHGLEESIRERSADLERRTIQMQAAADVGQIASTILDTDQLIQQVINLIQERFGLYYVGVYLLDEQGVRAVLRAGTGTDGRALLARQHAVRRGEGMVGWCLQHGQPRIALEDEIDRSHPESSELPLTRSEAVIPLRARSQVMGVLSAQSEQPNAFDAPTIAILQTMADQVAVAISNARLFAESRQALDATHQAYGQMTRTAWANLLRAQEFQGYFCDDKGLQPLAATQESRISGDTRVINLPIQVRGQVIGSIVARKPEGEANWRRDEVALLETLTDQLSIALDNARLFSDTQRTAEREHILSDITAKVRTSTNMETILQTAVRELAEALRISKASIQLRSDDGSNSSGG